MNTQTATEYRNLPLAVLIESATNPRRTFEDSALKELAESIRTQGVLSPLLVRPVTEQSFEIVAGAQRYRAAQIAEAVTVPVRIVNLTDAEALEAQLIENLQRSDVHPLEEARGFEALLKLEDPKYSIEQIAAKVAKTPAYVAQRIRLTELSDAAPARSMPRRSASDMPYFSPNSNPSSRSRPSSTASAKSGAARETRPSTSCFPSAISSTGSSTTFSCS
jgi:ParB/RepB/Spo0J family partition protein